MAHPLIEVYYLVRRLPNREISLFEIGNTRYRGPLVGVFGSSSGVSEPPSEVLEYREHIQNEVVIRLCRSSFERYYVIGEWRFQKMWYNPVIEV